MKITFFLGSQSLDVMMYTCSPPANSHLQLSFEDLSFTVRSRSWNGLFPLSSFLLFLEGDDSLLLSADLDGAEKGIGRLLPFDGLGALG